jgi:hypothetical protein
VAPASAGDQVKPCTEGMVPLGLDATQLTGTRVPYGSAAQLPGTIAALRRSHSSRAIIPTTPGATIPMARKQRPRATAAHRSLPHGSRHSEVIARLEPALALSPSRALLRRLRRRFLRDASRRRLAMTWLRPRGGAGALSGHRLAASAARLPTEWTRPSSLSRRLRIS